MDVPRTTPTAAISLELGVWPVHYLGTSIALREANIG